MLLLREKAMSVLSYIKSTFLLTFTKARAYSNMQDEEPRNRNERARMRSSSTAQVAQRRRGRK